MSYPNTFISKHNFELAFARIVRGQNREYKLFVRHLFPSYQLALTENVEDLIKDIKAFRYQPSAPCTVFMPKKSKILRPLKILTLRDQVVYQALVNFVARHFRSEQQKFAMDRTFGAIVSEKDNTFFYCSWKSSYRIFNRKITEAFDAGNDYVADFDLVSFFELIDHELLRHVLEQRIKNVEFLDLLFRCLRKWTENVSGAWLGHGIPQGPEASAFLAECFLFSFDRIKFKNIIYLRYVDDIKLMAKSEVPLRRALLQLDIFTKQFGLVPQAQKIACRQVKDLGELIKTVPSAVVVIEPRKRVSKVVQGLLEGILRSSIAKRDGIWYVSDDTKFKFSLFRMNPRRKILRRIAQILPHRPDLSWVFAGYCTKYPCDKEAADLLLSALRDDPTYDAASAEYIDAMDECEPASDTKPYRRVIQTAEGRSQERSILLPIAAASFRGRRAGPKDAIRLIERQDHPLVRSILLHRLFGLAAGAPYRPEDALDFIIQQTESNDSDLSRYAASCLVGLWPWKAPVWTPSPQINDSVKLLLKSVGMRKRGPRKIGVLERFFAEKFNIAIPINWRKALGSDFQDAERRCLRLQQFEVGDPSAWTLSLDTFNEVLVQNLSRKHPGLTTAYSRATKTGHSHPDYGNWLNNGTFIATLPNAVKWLQDVHATRVAADLAHAKTRKGQKTRPVDYKQRDLLKKPAKVAWAHIIREWVKHL